MRCRSASLVALCLAVIALPGCASLDSLRPGAGTKFDVTSRTYDEIWNASLAGVGKNLNISTKDKVAGVIKANSGPGMTTWGEVVGVFITPAKPEQPHYTVEVQSLKRYRLQITGTDWEPIIAEAIRTELR